MDLSERIYFLTLAGATGGLSAWAFAAVISITLLGQRGLLTSDFIAILSLGAFVGVFTITFADRRFGDRVSAGQAFFGLAIGIGAGLIAAFVQMLVSQSLSGQIPAPTRVFSWMLAGSLIGLLLGLRWADSNRLRAPYALFSGLVGAGLAGLLFALLEAHAPYFFQALGFVLTGAAVSVGIALAPLLIQGGVLQFVSSGDTRAQSKLSRPHKEWILESGRYYTIGSQGSGRAGLAGQQPIFLPDSAVAPQHAIVLGRKGRFYVARHPSIADQAGLAHFVLRLRGRTVVNRRELRDSDDLLIGRTALRFASRDVAASANMEGR